MIDLLLFGIVCALVKVMVDFHTEDLKKIL